MDTDLIKTTSPMDLKKKKKRKRESHTMGCPREILQQGVGSSGAPLRVRLRLANLLQELQPMAGTNQR
jgi:hypothetical protein